MLLAEDQRKALRNLADRVEDCGINGDVQLDAAICRAVFKPFWVDTEDGMVKWKEADQWARSLPAYTFSLDDAHSLVRCPVGRGPGWCWQIDARMDHQGSHYFAQITVPSSEWYGRGRTAALALTAAALRVIAEG